MKFVGNVKGNQGRTVQYPGGSKNKTTPNPNLNGRGRNSYQVVERAVATEEKPFFRGIKPLPNSSAVRKVIFQPHILSFSPSTFHWLIQWKTREQGHPGNVDHKSQPPGAQSLSEEQGAEGTNKIYPAQALYASSIFSFFNLPPFPTQPHKTSPQIFNPFNKYIWHNNN